MKRVYSHLSHSFLYCKRIDANLTQGLTQTFKQASYVLNAFASVKKGSADNKFLTQFKGNSLTLKIGLVEKTIFIFYDNITDCTGTAFVALMDMPKQLKHFYCKGADVCWTNKTCSASLPSACKQQIKLLTLRTQAHREWPLYKITSIKCRQCFLFVTVTWE